MNKLDTNEQIQVFIFETKIDTNLLSLIEIKIENKIESGTLSYMNEDEKENNFLKV